MKLIHALAGLGLGLTFVDCAGIVQPIVPVDCALTSSYRHFEVFLKSAQGGQGNNKIHIQPLSFATGAALPPSTEITAALPTKGFARWIDKINACGVSHTSHYMYCTVRVPNQATPTQENHYDYLLARVETRGGGVGKIAYCAKYDLTVAPYGAAFPWANAATDIMPTGGDFMYNTGINGGAGADTYYSVNTNDHIMMSYANPDRLRCFTDPDDVDTTTKMTSVTGALADVVGNDIAVLGGTNEMLTVHKAAAANDATLRAITTAGGEGTAYGTITPAIPASNQYGAVFRDGNTIIAHHVGVGPAYYRLTPQAAPQETTMTTISLPGNYAPAVGNAVGDFTSADGASCSSHTSCSCAHGTASTTSSCSMLDHERCTQCNVGHKLVLNKCSTTCETGYTMNVAGVCVQNLCTCPNGLPATGTLCAANTISCDSCSTGYTLAASAVTGYKVCSPIIKKCTCSNGVAMTGDSCLVDGAEACQSCTGNYHKEGKLCVANSCTCEHGVEDDAQCTEHMTESCGTCSSGFVLVGKRCQARDVVPDSDDEVPRRKPTYPDMGSMPENIARAPNAGAAMALGGFFEAHKEERTKLMWPIVGVATCAAAVVAMATALSRRVWSTSSDGQLRFVEMGIGEVSDE